jgi:hypothetical protein
MQEMKKGRREKGKMIITSDLVPSRSLVKDKTDGK